MKPLVKFFLAACVVAVLFAAVQDADASRRKPRTQPSCACFPILPASQPVGPDPRPLVWVLDGAGDFKGCSTGLTEANALADQPVELNVFPWSHGYRQVVRDQLDWEHAKKQGVFLAETIRARTELEPHRRMVIAAHSAGSAVALYACEFLPPDTIDRIILLAPSVSTGYDLRPSLWVAREGVDVFCSRKDWLILGLAVRVLGTTDSQSRTAAGRFGFQTRCEAASDPLVAAKLRHHFWSADQKWTGHTGGHTGMHNAAFIHAYLFPLIVR